MARRHRCVRCEDTLFVHRADEFPAAELNGALLDGDCDPRRHLGQEIFDDPLHRFLALPAAGIEPLVKVAFAVQQRHRNERHIEVGGSPNRVSGKDPKPPLYVGSPISIEK